MVYAFYVCSLGPLRLSNALVDARVFGRPARTLDRRSHDRREPRRQRQLRRRPACGQSIQAHPAGDAPEPGDIVQLRDNTALRQHHAARERRRVQVSPRAGRGAARDRPARHERLHAVQRARPVEPHVSGQAPRTGRSPAPRLDVQRGEVVALPIALLVLVLIFASVVAALLPLGVGVLAIVGGVGGTLFLGRLTDVSQYAINVVTLIGLAVAIDYSLFIVSRFRDELAAGSSREEALAITMATAGRAITFSGITVAIGLSAMLFFQGTFLASMGAAGAIVVGIAVLYGLTFLPALLSVMGGAVNFRILSWLLGAWGVRPTWWPSHQRQEGGGVWHSMAVWVMRRPVLVLVPALAVLVIAGTPFLQLRLANGDVDQLPPSNLARQGYDTLVKDFPGQDQTSIEAVVYYPDSSP